MSFDIIDAEQRSAVWYAARLGRLCASDAGKMLATIKSGEAAARRDLRMRLVCERLTNRPGEDSASGADIERGIALEPQARIAYEFTTGANVRQVGFLRHREHLAGASPDGVIGDFEGLVELKAPRSARHLSYVREGGIPSEHRPQLLHQLWISGARYVDFVSFDPLMPEALQLFVMRMGRNDDEIATYERHALAFLREVENEVLAVTTMADVTNQLKAALA